MKKIWLCLAILLGLLSFSAFADTELGDVVFYENFESLTSPRSGSLLSARMSSDFGGGSITLYDGGSGTSYTIDSPLSGGSKMLGIGGSAQYPQLMLPNLNLTKAGKYTLVYDYYVPSSLSLWFLQTGLSTTRRFTYVKGALQTVTETFEIEDGSGSAIPNIFIQAGKDTSVTTDYFVDNIRLYYLAPNVDYGLLIGSQDFEKSDSLAQSLGETGSGVYNFGTGASFGREIPSGVSGVSTMLKVTTTTQTAATAGYANMSVTRAGVYTVVFDCYMPSDYPLGRFRVVTNLSAAAVTLSLQKGTLNTYTASFVLEEGETLRQLFFESYNFGSVINDSYYLDNIKLYYSTGEYLFSDFAGGLVTTFIGDAKTSRGFAWKTSPSFNDMVIRYAASADGLAAGFTEVSAETEAYDGALYYKADVTGLAAGTSYVYVVGDKTKNAWSEEFTFETEAEDVSSYRVLAFADPQVDNPNVANVWNSNAQKALADVPDAKMILTLGDIVNLGSDETQWSLYFNGLGETPASVPNMTVIGNHEAREGEAGKNYRLHFNNPDNGRNALESLTRDDVSQTFAKELIDNFAETVYSFDYGDVHYAALNTGSDWSATTDGLAFVRAQLAWLENDLYHSDAKWKIVMLHRPVYEAYGRGGEGHLEEILDSVMSEYGVDLVLQGHEHFLVRTYPMKNGQIVTTADPDNVTKGSGTVYFTAGRASNLYVSSVTNLPDYVAKYENTAGGNPTYSVITVNDQTLSVVTKTLNDEILDSFVITDTGSGTEEETVRGELLVDEDFEDVADGTVIFNDTSCGTLPAYKNAYVAATNPGNASVYASKLFSVTRGGEVNTSYVTTFGGNKVVRVDQRIDGASKTPQIGLYGGHSNANASLGLIASGTYTVTADVYLPPAFAAKVDNFFVQYALGDGYGSAFTAVDASAAAGRWYTLTAKVRLDGTKELKFFRFIANAKSVSDGLYFFVDNVRLYCEPDKAYLHLSSDSITTEGQSVTITPYVSADDQTVLSDTHYTTDSVCADLVRNNDGTATLTGKINGSVTVTAHFSNENIPDVSVTVPISGQGDRVAATSLKVLMFGNSILNHPQNAEIGWYGNWGMAASAEDKDYAHRLKYYIDEKYGEGTADIIRGYWIAGLEGVWREHQSDPDYDYTSAMSGHMASVAENAPDVITIQCGENASVTDASGYQHATGQLVAAFREIAPNAVIIVCTPFWGGDAMVTGMNATAEAYGIHAAQLHTLNTPENKATGLFAHGGVANHPGDTGMDNIAKLIFAELNAVLSENSPVNYTAQPASVVISGEDVISTDSGSIALAATVYPADASGEVVWSVDDESVAAVDQNGVVTAIADGRVTIKATSRYNDAVFGTHTVTVTGQSEPFTVRFRKNADEDVTDMPAPILRKGVTSLAAVGYPSRAYYRFMGWTLSPDGAPVSEVNVVSDVTLYAKWLPATAWDFERDGDREGFVILNGFNQYVENGVFHAIATDTDTASGNVLTLLSPALAVNSEEFQSLVVRMQHSVFDANTAVVLTVSATGGTYTYAKSVTSTAFTDYTFDLSGVSGVITGFTVVPVNMDCTVRFDEISFEPIASAGTDYFTCSDGYVSVKASVDTTVGGGTHAVIAYYEGARLVKTELRTLESGTETLYSSFGTDKRVDRVTVFILNGLAPAAKEKRLKARF